MIYCQDCMRHIQEIANMADEIAFWAFKAKWYYAAANGLGKYDELPIAKQKEIDAVFERHRIAENQERIGPIEPAWDIGS